MAGLDELAALIHERNSWEERISAIIGRPASIGHLGEFIASAIFGIRLAANANHKSIDGWFEHGPLEGRSVNVKWYAKRERLLDMCVESGPDFYLVLAGPSEPNVTTHGPRPWLIESVYLFEDTVLRGLVSSKIGVATSVRHEVWERHQIFPNQNPALMALTDVQLRTLRSFGQPKI